MNTDVSKYLTQQIMTASPARLVSMLYDKAISSLREAIAAIEANDIEARWRANARATEIITNMWSNLDKDNGGDIAENLEQIFSFVLNKLPDVDLNNDPAPAEEAITLLEPIAASWRELARQDSGAGAMPRDGAGAGQPQSGLSQTISV